MNLRFPKYLKSKRFPQITALVSDGVEETRVTTGFLRSSMPV